MPEKNFSIAPMLDVTDRHCRVLFRLLSRSARLYTEMVPAGAVIYGDRARLMGFDPMEHPLAIQFGGNDPRQLAECAKIAVSMGYDEVNLNVGCPSARVKQGRFGACLMAQPQLVADCVGAMSDAVAVPITVKTRIGIDHRDSYAQLAEFVRIVQAAGCRHFIVHARKAWLQGLSPKQNRNVPPLEYDRVYKLKRDFPELTMTINGGVTDLDQIERHWQRVDGVMMGRSVYRNPWLLTEVERRFYDRSEPVGSRVEVVHAYLDYIERQLLNGVLLSQMSRHLLPLFHAQPGARGWRRYLSEHSPARGAGVEVIERALKSMVLLAEQESEQRAVAYPSLTAKRVPVEPLYSS